jgi:hypothetical protein
MTTSVCSIRYQTEEINRLPNIVEAKDEDLQESAEFMGRLFAKHKVEQFIAVTRLHNHYPLEGNQKVVISSHPGGNSIPRGSEKNPENVLVKKPMTIADDGDVVPVNFIVKQDGTLCGAEYMEISLANKINLPSTINSVLQNQAFMEELTQTMVVHGLWDKIGFQFIFEPFLFPDRDPSHNLMEDNWHDSYQEVMYRARPAHGSPTITSWRFTKTCDCERDSCDDALGCTHGDCDGYCWCLMVGQTGHGGHAWHSNCG